MATTLGPTTSLHFTANGNFVNGVYTPATDGFNLADVGSADMLNYLPAGVKGLVWVGMTDGVTAAFKALVDSCKGNPNLYGFYLADEPGASPTIAANLMAEADYIHANLPGAKTFMVEQNLSSNTSPIYYYTPANTHIDLFGLDPYPVQTNVPNNLDYNIIPLAVAEAEKVGIPLADIVPVYQAFGGGSFSTYFLPTVAQEEQIMATWASAVPTPAFDYTYSWGSQNGDTALSNDPVLQAVFAAHNGVAKYAVSDSLPNIIANLQGLNALSGITSLTGLSGTATLSGYAIGAPRFTLAGSGTALTVAENLSYLGALTVGAGATLSVASGDTLATTGALTINGALTGAGKLSQTGGSIAFGSGASFNIASWTSKNATITIAAFRTYAGVFSAGAGATLNLSGGNLVLTGANSFSGATVTGGHVLVDAGASSVSGLTIGGTAMFQNNSTLTQSGGTVTVGDASGNAAILFNAGTGTYDITDDSGIALGTSAASRIVNYGLFEKTGGAGTSAVQAKFVSTGTVTAATGTIAFSGTGNSFSGTIGGAGAVSFNGGASTIAGGTTVGVASLTATGASTTLVIAGNLSNGGSFSDASGATVLIASGATLSLSGSAALGARVVGAGSLAITGGTTTINPSAVISAASLSVTGAGTTLAVGTGFGFGHTFSAGGGATLNLSGGNLVLTGANSFSGATVTGGHVLVDAGTSSVSGLTIGGTAMFQNNSTLTQSGGTVTVGDASGNAATLLNASTGTYKIADDSGIAQGTSAASKIANYGLFEKTLGTGTSVIAPSFLNAHAVLASSGTLDFAGAVTGTGTDTIAGAATLEFASTVAAGQTVLFSGANGVLDLTDPTGFAGSISGFAKGDTVDFAGAWSLLSVTQNSARTMSTLTLQNGAATDVVQLVGAYASTDFSVALAGTTTILGHV